MLHLLHDMPVAVQPGQLSAYGVLADLYIRAFWEAKEKLDDIPRMVQEGIISAQTSYELTILLEGSLLNYADFLATIGYPQPYPQPRQR